MNRESFIVRMHLEPVDRFRERTTWEQLMAAMPYPSDQQ